ncbi:MAG TPA: BlaI/MecI/CopY family transcriptional regulator [Oscillospiraceae bacterium]|nr:BlaI/MecI/CopY family transcriptional regulator [Oscillospiraceae bacterium]HPF56584.1 BlaI/MecI/CopY family transcriptional regulator [Clostridiales bacterium]HPK36340.1 BlaI/MecI/CopY family transcriptional regulator [Oscillospiraceae bacterium]HPR76113.1 BlaI/MecI/CopY family transcriptional regulator [Oscillospiraceae bacterium]
MNDKSFDKSFDKSLKITDSESEVMKTLWTAGKPLPVSVITDELSKKCGWDSSTTRTLLRRLCQKDAVRAEKKEIFYYSPIVTEQEYNLTNTQQLIDRLYGGSVKDLVAAMLSQNRLGDDDIAELREMFKVENPEDQNE